MHPVTTTSAPRQAREPGAARARATKITFSGIVVQGRGISGPILDHPTFNLVPRQPIVLRHGTYLAHVAFGGLVAPATLYWGRRPTLERDGAIVCEAHVLSGPVAVFEKAYELDVQVYTMLRVDEHFASLEALRRRLRDDRQEARLWFQGQGTRLAANGPTGNAATHAALLASPSGGEARGVVGTAPGRSDLGTDRHDATVFQSGVCGAV